MKKVLITGAGSYIGEKVKEYLMQWPKNYSVDMKNTMGWKPIESDFTGFDVVFNVAGIAHRKETAENRHLYYDVNRDLVIKIAENAKAAGVKQFILLSTMSVYGMVEGRITKSTKPHPVNAYGKSKVEADEAIEKMADDNFKFCCLRPPMVYGKGCKGNYQSLRSFALKSPIFPDYKNQRSMIFIGNLCEFVKDAIDQEKSGLFFPQNAEYTRTSDMVKLIAEAHGKKIRLTKAFNWAIKICGVNVVKKVFGDLVYEPVDTVEKYSLYESIKLTEMCGASNGLEGKSTGSIMENKKKNALCIASVASNLDNFNRSNVEILRSLGYDVTLAANFHTTEDINSQKKIDSFAEEMREQGVHIVHIDFTRSPKNVLQQIKSIRQVRELLKQQFDLIHCHTPIAAAIVRFEAKKYRKTGTKVFYTAHGFHFYDGAPAVNWLIFYPIEKLCSLWTDVLITINQEDYKRAKEHFYAKKVVHVPGIGVDTEKFDPRKSEITTRNRVRKELHLPSDAFLLASVGELNSNKNHSAVIKAIKECNDAQIHYLIAGQGGMLQELQNLSDSLNIKNNIHLVGYRTDIADIYLSADVCVFPSIREGLGLAGIEGMASGLPLIVSDNRGTRDFADNEGSIVCAYDDIKEFAKAILRLKNNPVICQTMGAYNREISVKFDTAVVKCIMEKVYYGI